MLMLTMLQKIYPKYYKPEHFIKLGQKRIEKLIKKIEFLELKLKYLPYVKKILEMHNGKFQKL